MDEKELAAMDKTIAELQEKVTAAKSKVKSMENSKPWILLHYLAIFVFLAQS